MVLAAQLVRAQVELAATPKDEHGLKSAPLANYGVYEVRLVDLAKSARTGRFVFWLELFDHNEEIALDSGSANNLCEALTIAEELISSARELSKE
jgi:hypothetical protein